MNSTIETPTKKTDHMNGKQAKNQIKIFWFSEQDKEGNVKNCKVDHLKFIDFLKEQGFRRYDVQEDFTFIKITDNIIEEVTTTYIQDFVINYIKSFYDANRKEEEITEEQVLNAFYRSPNIYFSKSKLSLIGNETIEINQDEIDSSFFYFLNGFVHVSRSGIYLHPYTDLKQYIWKNQIIERTFNPNAREKSNFQTFIWNISGQKESRFQSLKTIIGYLLHSFYDYQLKAVNLTDSKIGDFDEGRTGKTLLGRAAEKIKNLVELAGKSFNPEDEKKYMEVGIGTQIVHINDAKNNLNFELLYNDITDGMRVRKLYLKPFIVHAKLIISSNKPLAVHGSSAKARVIEFELADHYSKDFTPEHEFGEWFFRDWNSEAWECFDAFMINCSHEYFIYGLIEPDEINLSQRKLINETAKEFAEFMDSCFVHENEIPFIVIGREFDKKELYNKFIKEYEDYGDGRNKITQRRFTRWLQIFAINRKLTYREDKSGDLRSMTFFQE